MKYNKGKKAALNANVKNIKLFLLNKNKNKNIYKTVQKQKLFIF